VASTTLVSNLNAEKWNGKSGGDFSATLNFGNIAAQDCATLTISFPGAAANSPIAPSWPAAIENGLLGIMWVSVADTISVRLCNVTTGAIDPASATFAGRVVK